MIKMSCCFQLISAGVLDKSDYPDFDEETGVLPKEDEGSGMMFKSIIVYHEILTYLHHMLSTTKGLFVNNYLPKGRSYLALKDCSRRKQLVLFPENLYVSRGSGVLIIDSNVQMFQ